MLDRERCWSLSVCVSVFSFSAPLGVSDAGQGPMLVSVCLCVSVLSLYAPPSWGE